MAASSSWDHAVLSCDELSGLRLACLILISSTDLSVAGGSAALMLIMFSSLWANNF